LPPSSIKKKLVKLCDGGWFRPMRPKARGLAQHGGRLAGWRRVTRQVRFVRDGRRSACLFRTVSIALTRASQLRAEGISSFCYIVNVHNYPSCKEGIAWYSSRSMPSLWFRPCCIYPELPVQCTLYTVECQLEINDGLVLSSLQAKL
jgi:hypothetical protein